MNRAKAAETFARVLAARPVRDAASAHLDARGTVMALGESEIALSGGLGSSSAFATIVADVTGRRVRRGAHAQGASLGAAVCAATGIGGYGSLREAAAAMVASAATLVPDPERHSIYRDAFESWYARWQILQSIT